MDLKQIEIIAESKGIKIKDLAEKAEVAFSGLYRSIKENTIKASTLEKIAEILEVSILAFFEGESDLGKEVFDLNNKNIKLEKRVVELEWQAESNKYLIEYMRLDVKHWMNLFVKYQSYLNRAIKENPELFDKNEELQKEREHLLNGTKKGDLESINKLLNVIENEIDLKIDELYKKDPIDIQLKIDRELLVNKMVNFGM